MSRIILSAVGLLALVGCDELTELDDLAPAEDTGGFLAEAAAQDTADPAQDEPGDDTGDEAAATQPVYLAFSGGGWHSHTALSGWFAGMLAADGGTLDDVMGSVEAISSNSGGSWFLTQLAYSDTFRTSLEDEPEYWTTPNPKTGEGGYIAQTAALFHNAHPCRGWSLPNRLICERVPWTQEYFEMMNLAGSSSLNWQNFVEDMVFEPFEMNQELAGVEMSGARQSWSSEIDLIVAASLMTDDVVLNEDSSGLFSSWDQLYQLALPGGQATQNFTTMYFSSVVGGRTAPALLGAGDLSGEWWSNWSPGSRASGSLPGARVDVGVIDAATASSAAPAAVASVRAAGEAGWSSLSSTISYYAADLAPPVEISASGIDFLGTVADYTGSSGLTYSGLAASGTARVADGGYLDNTSLAYLLRHLSENSLIDGAQVVLFMNSSSSGGATAGTQVIPESVGVLFGYEPAADGNGSFSGPSPYKAIDFCDDGHCVSTFSAQVFDESVWSGVSGPDWSHSEDGVQLRYYALDVTTVDNAVFGVDAGDSIALHLFINEDFQSSALPTTQAIMDSYTDVYDVTRAAVTGEGGWAYLVDALQIR